MGGAQLRRRSPSSSFPSRLFAGDTPDPPTVTHSNREHGSPTHRHPRHPPTPPTAPGGMCCGLCDLCRCHQTSINHCCLAHAGPCASSLPSFTVAQAPATGSKPRAVLLLDGRDQSRSRRFGHRSEPFRADMYIYIYAQAISGRRSLLLRLVRLRRRPMGTRFNSERWRRRR